MTVLVHDAKKLYADRMGADMPNEFGINEILYADDTLLVGVSAQVLEEYMECIRVCGSQYGMSFNANKFEALQMNCVADLHTGQGVDIPVKASIKYLGALLSADGHSHSEVSRRIGMAKAEFALLRKCWQHSSLTIKDKTKIYYAIVVSGLLYGMESLALCVNDKRKLDGFHAKCCRSIAHISASYISRVSNKFVFQTLNVKPMSETLLKRQLQFFGTIARKSDEDVIRKMIFKPSSCAEASVDTRKPGRPRINWKQQMFKHAFTIAGNTPLHDMLSDKQAWCTAVRQYCSELS